MKHQPAFDFLARPPRSVKLRKLGLTVVSGPGADRFDIARWLIGEFGPDVNLVLVRLSARAGRLL